ncbi:MULTISPECIES: cation:proton antiporter [Streptomyces]|uniref:cation:proton antiporter n=1 Tax=Streptomyces TaxID=1883 RepID=UPI000BF2122E|nr:MULTISPECIES: cation:proton antiporter [Streptomyces]RUP64283.1 potassium/proton antiporter [Streptomyces sp. NP10]WST51632.1 cation:proton antiporter [Streptomyces rubiginosohelvolus]
MHLSTEGAVYSCLGIGALLAAALPRLLSRLPVSVPIVFLAAGMVLHLTPLPLPAFDPVADRIWVHHLTELCVIVSLMGAGLAINRPFGWRSWAATWRLLGLAMPLTIGATALAAWALLDWPVSVALLVAAVLAPTDPVLASEVRVGEPSAEKEDEDEVRFALTSEAGLNDGLAFPFVLAALALAAAGNSWTGGWMVHWVWSDVLIRIAVGVTAGLAIGFLLGRLLFRSRAKPLRLAEQGEGFVALAATFLAYGLTEALHGYGFLAVFVTACALRRAEHSHGYHRVMHSFVEQIERLLMALLLFAVGAYVASGGLAALTWKGAAVGVLLHLLIRPASGWLAQLRGPGRPNERAAIACFGIRGIGSLFYLAYACGEGEFGVYEEEMWAVVVFAVLTSVVVHGVAAAPVTSYLDRRSARDPLRERPGHERVPGRGGGTHQRAEVRPGPGGPEAVGPGGSAPVRGRAGRHETPQGPDRR